jgi:hypothetical protein
MAGPDGTIGKGGDDLDHDVVRTPTGEQPAIGSEPVDAVAAAHLDQIRARIAQDASNPGPSFALGFKGVDEDAVNDPGVDALDDWPVEGTRAA